MKKILHIILWPIIFILGQFFIQNLFIASFNSHNIDTYRKLYKSFTDLEIIETSQYKTDLLNYMNSHALLITFIAFVVFGIIFLILIKPYNKNEINTNISLKTIILIILSGISVAIFYNTLIYFINNVIHITDNYMMSNIPLFILVLTTGIMGPILEELLFRGIVYNRLQLYLNHKKSVIIASILFSLMHFPNIINMIYTFFLSFIMIYLYDKYKTLKLSILFHIIINITVLFLVYILIQNNILINTLLLIISLITTPILLTKLYKS